MLFNHDRLVYRIRVTEIAGFRIDDVAFFRHDRVARRQQHHIGADGDAVCDCDGSAVENCAVCVDEDVAREALTLAAAKLPFATTFVKRTVM